MILNKISSNFRQWHCRVLDNDMIMYSRRFFGNTHRQIKNNFHSAFNCFDQGNKTIIVSCFNTYTNIAIFDNK